MRCEYFLLSHYRNIVGIMFLECASKGIKDDNLVGWENPGRVHGNLLGFHGFCSMAPGPVHRGFFFISRLWWTFIWFFRWGFEELMEGFHRHTPWFFGLRLPEFFGLFFRDDSLLTGVWFLWVLMVTWLILSGKQLFPHLLGLFSHMGMLTWVFWMPSTTLDFQWARVC